MLSAGRAAAAARGRGRAAAVLAATAVLFVIGGFALVLWWTGGGHAHLDQPWVPATPAVAGVLAIAAIVLATSVRPRTDRVGPVLLAGVVALVVAAVQAVVFFASTVGFGCHGCTG